MARLPSQLPSALGHAFTPAQARALGVPAHRLRARDIAHPHRGLLVSTAAQDEGDVEGIDPDAPFALDQRRRLEMHRRASLYAEVMVGHAFFVGRTAAGLWGLPVDCSGALEVGVVAPHRAPRRSTIEGRQIADHLVSVRDVDGLRASSPASTWAMLASVLSLRDLVRVGDAVVRVPRDERGIRHPDRALATLDQLRSAIDAGRRTGAGRLRDAIDLIRVGSASPLETDFRMDAAAGRLPEPELDVEIRDRSGRLIGITEIVYPEFGVLVEVEGDHHRTSTAQWNRDIEKYAAYAALGYEVVRLTSAHIRGDSPRSTSMVRRVLTRRGWTG